MSLYLIASVDAVAIFGFPQPAIHFKSVPAPNSQKEPCYVAGPIIIIYR